MGQLNRIAVAGLGMRKHAHPDGSADNKHGSREQINHNSINNTSENSYPWKRPRGNDDYADRNSAEVKIETAVHGLPTLS